MLVTRFLPDVIVLAAALLASLVLLRLMPHRVLRGVILAGSLLLFAGAAVVLLEATQSEAGFRWMLLGGLALIWAVSLILATVILYSIRKLAKPAVLERRRLLTATAMAAPAAILGYGGFIGRRQFHLREVELLIPGLAPDLDGLRIAQLSDIHLSPYLSRADLQWCVDLANESRPHLAAITGDLITGIHDSIDDCLEELRRLRTDAGVFGCNGNHEGYIHAEAYTAERAASLGMKFLRSERTNLRFGAASINLAGLDHQYSKWNYARSSRNLLQPSELNLLLNHNPAMFPHIADQGWDVTLSGHMHGGQINLELVNANYNLARFSTPYVYGTYTEARSTMYVTRGIGTIGVPIRLGAAPEVALIRLRRTPAIL